MSMAFNNNVSALWQDICSAIENKEIDPFTFNRFYIGRIESSSAVPLPLRKCLKRNKPVLIKERFILNAPLAGIALTKREIQVLYLICTGYTNRQVADQIGLSARTAEYYINNMRKKTLTSSKAHLIQLICQTDFLQRIRIQDIEDDERDILNED